MDKGLSKSWLSNRNIFAKTFQNLTMRHYDTTALFYCIDEFCKIYKEWEKHKLIPKTGKRERAGKLSLSEMLCIEVLFHLSGFRDFKTFYEYGINAKYKKYFKPEIGIK